MLGPLLVLKPKVSKSHGLQECPLLPTFSILLPLRKLLPHPRIHVLPSFRSLSGLQGLFIWTTFPGFQPFLIVPSPPVYPHPASHPGPPTHDSTDVSLPCFYLCPAGACKNPPTSPHFIRAQTATRLRVGTPVLSFRLKHPRRLCHYCSEGDDLASFQREWKLSSSVSLNSPSAQIFI